VCSVLRVCTSPYPYFHLTFPERVEQTEVRQSERAATTIPAWVSTPSGEKIDAQIRDISASGAMLLVTQPVGEAAQTLRVGFDLTFAQIARSLELAAIIRNVNQVQGQNSPRIA